jgi:SNF2 family DNA or RNA helicase
MKWVPKPYQVEAVKFMLAGPADAVWARVGSGKTSATLAAIETMHRKAGFRTLVVAPKHVALNVWAQEAAKWDFSKHLRVAVLHGNKKDQLRQKGADIYVVNYDGLAWLEREMPPFDVLVLDESSKCRNTDTQRFKILRDHIAPRAKRRIALSGTPKPNGEINLFGQYRLLDDGQRLGRYVTHFRRQFCYQTGFGGYTWALLPGASEKIREAVADITIVVDADDVKGLPEVVVRDVEVPLPSKARKLYDDLEREFLVQVDEGDISAMNAAALTMKLRQIASGAVYTGDAGAGTWAEVHDARIGALDSIVEEAAGPVLVFYEFTHEAERIKAEFPEAVIFNDLSDRKKVGAIEDWNRGAIEMLVAHPASAGHGLNLQHGGHEMVWFSLLYDLELYEQAIGRLARQGQESKHVHVHRFVSPGTVDEAMAAALARKAKGQNAFLDALKEYAQVRKGARR